MITFNNVKFAYPYAEHAVLKGASFSLTNGVNTLLCDTQSGKTTVCKLLCKQIALADGEIVIDETPIVSITNAHLGILYLPQNPAFFEGRSVLYNVEYPLRVRKTDKATRKSKVMEVASRLGLDGLLSEKVKKLTTTERRLVALARGLTVPRKVVLFDDFFAEADQTDNSLLSVNNVLQAFGDTTTILVTSNAQLATGNTVVLDGGVAIYQGDAEGARQVVNNIGWLHNQLRSE